MWVVGCWLRVVGCRLEKALLRLQRFFVEMMGCDGQAADALGDGFEAVAAFAERQVQGELAGGAEQIEGHEDDRDGCAQLVGDTLAADALTEHGEGKGVRGSCAGHFAIPSIAMRLR